MRTELPLRGTDLRYVIVDQIYRDGPQSIADIIEGLRYHGFTVRGYAAKTVGDALRWEARRGRLRRLRRGFYGPGEMPRTTEQRIHRRALELRAEAAVSIGRTDEQFWKNLSLYLEPEHLSRHR